MSTQTPENDTKADVKGEGSRASDPHGMDGFQMEARQPDGSALAEVPDLEALPAGLAAYEAAQQAHAKGGGAGVDSAAAGAVARRMSDAELEALAEGSLEEGSESREVLPAWTELSQARRMAVIEALIFAAEQPLTLKDLRQLLGIRSAEILRLISAIREDLAPHRRGLMLEEVGGGFVFRTRPELSPWVRAMVKTRPPRLTRAALECLAIVAYKQPCTRAEIEHIRGVESGHLLRGLLEKRLVRILGRKDDVGRPMIYGTTREFLQMFGLKDLTALPTLRDLNALLKGEMGPIPVGESLVESPLTEGAPAPELLSALQAAQEAAAGPQLGLFSGEPDVSTAPAGPLSSSPSSPDDGA